MAWWSASTDASSARCWASRVASHRDLETLLHGFNRAYNARRQRVLKGRSPERVVHDRLGAVPTPANSSHDPPFDPCALPKALQVIARAKDVSHPDKGDTCETSFSPERRSVDVQPGPGSAQGRGSMRKQKAALRGAASKANRRRPVVPRRPSDLTRSG